MAHEQSVRKNDRKRAKHNDSDERGRAHSDERKQQQMRLRLEELGEIGRTLCWTRLPDDGELKDHDEDEHEGEEEGVLVHGHRLDHLRLRTSDDARNKKARHEPSVGAHALDRPRALAASAA
eukprot:628047-Pleurochrysis_carterae.AAC.1